MKNITYISASAGSGKTYTLTEKVAELIKSGEAEPEQFIITTFTVAAAEEIRQEAKERLYKDGLNEAAERLDQALIGTIDSVCNAFVNRYWYLLGLNPELNVLDEENKNLYISQSLVNIATQDDLDFFADFCRKFNVVKKDSNSLFPQPNPDFWREHLLKVVEIASNYSITDFSASKAYSIRLISEMASGKEVNMPSKEEVDYLIEKMDASGMGKTAQDNFDKLKKEKNLASYNYIRKLSCFAPGKKDSVANGIIALFKDKYGSIMQSNAVIALQEEYVNRIFDIATRWQKVYADFKVKHHVVDFTDMGSKMLELLTDKRYVEAREEIKSNYRYALVDEFQDCSPMQVKIFDCLSELLTRSYWVGDSKQAIYGFRGTDSVLTDAVTEAVQKTDTCKMHDPLNTSWRSVPALVNFANDVFVPAFNEMPENRVCLNPCIKKTKEAESISDSLRYWALRGRNAENYKSELVKHIQDLCFNKKVLEKEICVLARDNESLNSLGKELAARGLKVDRLSKTFEGNQAADLVFAVLSLIENPYNKLARTEIAYLTAEGYDLSKIIDNSVAWNSLDEGTRNEYLGEIPVVKDVLEARNRFSYLSVKSLVESAIIELDLISSAMRIPSVDNADATMQALIQTATDYENRCTQLGLPATVGGFIAYARMADVKVNGAADGIHLSTYHSAKGLQWKYVILTSLDKEPNATRGWDKRNYSGVKAEHEIMPTAENIFTPLLIRVLPWIYGADESIPDDAKSKIDETRLEKIMATNVAEMKRLLYVGVTRAEDYLILAVNEKESNAGVKKLLGWFESIGTDISNYPYFVCESFKEVLDVVKPETVKLVNLKSSEQHKYQNRDIQPSGVYGRGDAEIVKDWHWRLRFPNNADDKTVGDCIHQIFCGIERENSIEHINDIVRSYNIDVEQTDANQIVEAWDKFFAFMEETYGKADCTYHELGFKHKANDQIVTGSMDFVWRTAEGVILVDYKTNRMTSSEIMNADMKNIHYPGIYRGQVDCYTAALEQAGEKVIARLIFYPSIGLIVGL